MENQKVALNVDECAEFLNYKKNYIYKLVSLGRLPVYRPLRGRLFFKRQELEDFVFRNSCRQGADYEGGAE